MDRPKTASDEGSGELRRRIDQVPRWRHRITVAPGVVTPGTEDTDQELTRLRLPSRLDGQRVLDIGASDGFYSFTAERRGAVEVLAIDDESSLLAGPDRQNGFRVAHELLGSSARYEARDVEQLDPDTDGTFDLVLFINVLYHLRNPMLALERIASVTKPGGKLVLKTYFRNDVRFWFRGRCVGVDIDPRPKWWYFPNSELGGDPTNWFAPNRRGLEGMLAATGWNDITRIGRHGDRLYYHATKGTVRSPG
jgi:tRNA (mo5U34)-methyltransferase